MWPVRTWYMGTCVSPLQSAESPKDVNKVMARFALDPVDELPMDQFRRLLLIGRSEVMPEVVYHMEREETQR